MSKVAISPDHGRATSSYFGNSFNSHQANVKLLDPSKSVTDPCGIKRYYYGNIPHNAVEKVFLIIGPSGSGKTTMVNFVANYFKGVKTPDDQVVVVASPSVKSKEIEAYTFCSSKEAGSIITVIDTPGFNNSSGSDIKAYINSLNTFIANAAAHQLNIHAIGFVAQAHLVKLTYSESLVLNYISTLFGEGIKNNIITLISFADVEKSPPLVEAMKNFSFKSKHFFKFNNAVLSGSSFEVDDLDRVYWRTGYRRWEKVITLLRSYEHSYAIASNSLDNWNMNLDIHDPSDSSNALQLSLGIKSNNHEPLKLLRPSDMILDPCGMKRYCYGHVSPNIEEKVILLIGSSGSGKTSLVNFAANYFEGVKTPDDKLIFVADPSVKTQEILAYTFYSIKYNAMTIIDAPGFSDSSYLEVKKYIKSLKKFLVNVAENGLKIHAIGFVAPSHLVKLSPSESLVLDYISTLIDTGEHDNIITLITFADVEERPPLVEAMQKYNTETKNFIKFNNAVLAGSSLEIDDIDRVYWRAGCRSWKRVVKLLRSCKHNVAAVALTQTSKPKQTQLRGVKYFESSNHDEITILPGDVLILTNDKVSPGWWEGTNEQGQRGVFPANHTEIIDYGPLEPSTFWKKCPYTLLCGHPCQAKRNEPCSTKCMHLEATNLKCPLNHQISVPCHAHTDLGIKIQKKAISEESLWQYCDTPCDELLECGHLCQGTCGSCSLGRIHISCKEQCSRTLICGHQCSQPCHAQCPPCQQQCPKQCPHGHCNYICGVVCDPCMNRCKRGCLHASCSLRCEEACNMEPCSEPCPKQLVCGHMCVGFCGEPCPPLCRQCHRSELTDFMLMGNEENEDARFVKLEDCGHVIESEGLDGWLQQNQDEILMKACPRCKNQVVNNQRYRNIIIEVQQKVNDVKQINFCKNKFEKTQDIIDSLKVYILQSHFNLELQQIMRNLQRARNSTLSNEELKLSQFQAQVMNKACTIIHDLKVADSTENEVANLRGQLIPYVKALLQRVMLQVLFINQQMIDDISCELQRLEILPTYWIFQSKSSDIENPDKAQQIKSILQAVKPFMAPTMKFNNDVETQVLSLLRAGGKCLSQNWGISNSEKVMIVQAVGLSQGHWYKCPNKHIYCIANCGNPNQDAVCPECRTNIGGTRNILAQGNIRADDEMFNLSSQSNLPLDDDSSEDDSS